MNFEYPSYWFEQFFLSGGIYDFECLIWPKNIHSELWKFGIWFSTLWIGFINFIWYAAYHSTSIEISGSKSRDRNWIDLIMWPLRGFDTGRLLYSQSLCCGPSKISYFRGQRRSRDQSCDRFSNYQPFDMAASSLVGQFSKKIF